MLNILPAVYILPVESVIAVMPQDKYDPTTLQLELCLKIRIS